MSLGYDKAERGGGIVPVQCADKASEAELAPPQSHWASQKRCEKVVICGPAHVGKSSLVENILVRSAPWSAVYIVRARSYFAAHPTHPFYIV